MDWLKTRLGEPSTLAGVGLLINGLLSVFGLGFGSQAADVATAAISHATTGDYVGAGVSLLTGAGAIIAKEKGR